MKKILIVEDDTALSKALATHLGEEDVEVFVASDGLEGYNTAVEKNPDVILLDLMMPNMDGMTMLKKLRETSGDKKLNVIILTNDTSNKNLAEAIENGVFSYLIKSNTSLEEIKDKVMEQLKM